jgi:signal transduction histidine kinase
VSAGVEYFQHVISTRDFARKYWFDVLIAVLAIAAMAEVLVKYGSPDSPTASLWFALPALAILVLPVFARRWFPFAGPASYWVLAAAITFINWRLIPSVESLFPIGLAVAFLLGNLRNALQAAIGLVVVVCGMTLLVYEIPDHSTAQLVFLPMDFAIAWLAGFALRERAVQVEAAEIRATEAERERDAVSRIAVAEERARIARELHDVVAHAVGVMVLQVGAVRHNLPADRAEDTEALQRVEATGRTALAEMRRMLGAMRREGDDLELAPQPGLDGLDSLLDEVDRAGLPVELHVDGEPFRLPQAIDLSAYRIVQEGLTNALKHAHASRADVTVRYAPEELEIEVRDDGAGNSASDGVGHGLIGIRERVKIYGGEMTAARANGGGFVLSTRLPLGDDRV